MDVVNMIQGLLDERDRIDATIARLEALQKQGKAAGSRRGRKAMSPTEREEVSRRMRNYWDQRRQAAVTGEAPVEELPATAKPDVKSAKAGAGK